jgi:putative radical SAM enzyme (TIGR03279 family)
MSGLVVRAVDPRSDLARLGLRAGDHIVAIDDLVPRDLIDLQQDLSGARALTVERAGDAGASRSAAIRRASSRLATLDARVPQRIILRPNAHQWLDPSAVTLEAAVPGGIRECNNHCEFCFIRGLPPGLRPSLYVFDDDYRYSFLWGNFLTLTNLDEPDWARIGYQRLSPLNVSVHATDDAVRRKLLNNRRAPSLLPQLRRLTTLGIEVNTQVVLCAGVNDGSVLDRTIEDLSNLYPTVRSLSVVPVGLTRYSRVKNIRRPTPAEADSALALCERWQATLRSRWGVGFVYGSDELYVLAERDELPPNEAYDGYPVLSNGVGLLRSMLDEWRKLVRRQPNALKARERKITWLTGRLAAPALERMADDWRSRTGWRPEVREVTNSLFGDQVTVSGLLSGVDLIDAVAALPDDVEDVLLPRGAFGFDGRCTLDGVSAEQVGAAHSARVHLASSPGEILAILAERS